MSEQIKILARDPASMLVFSAMVDHVGDDAFDKVFPDLKPEGNDTVVEARLVIDGVDVPVVAALTDAWRRMESGYKQHVRDAAHRQLMASTDPLVKLMTDLQDLLQERRWAIQEELDKMFPGTTWSRGDDE